MADDRLGTLGALLRTGLCLLAAALPLWWAYTTVVNWTPIEESVGPTPADAGSAGLVAGVALFAVVFAGIVTVLLSGFLALGAYAIPGTASVPTVPEPALSRRERLAILSGTAGVFCPILAWGPLDLAGLWILAVLGLGVVLVFGGYLSYLLG